VNVASFVVLVQRPNLPPSQRIRRTIMALADARGLAPLIDDQDLLVVGGAAAPHIALPEGAGLIWGHLFDRATATRLSAAQDSMMATAENFIARHWGGYVAIRRQAGSVEILRDPSGAVPCYHAAIDGTHIFTSRPELLFDTGLCKADIDWTTVAQTLAFRDLRPARTALRGVSELLPGMAARLTGDRVATHCLWSPWAFTSRADEIDDLPTATSLLRDTVRQCVAAWAGCFTRPIVEISGGLDSAIVAAGLTDARPLAITFGPTVGDPDELPYARAIADQLGFDLTVVSFDVADVDLRRSCAHDLPRPCARGFAQALDRPLQAQARSIGADAFFSGGGGDNVLCSLQSALPAADQIRRHGIGPGTIHTMLDIARLAQVTFWQVLAATLRCSLRPGHNHPPAYRNRYLSVAAILDLPWPAGHPWLEADPASLPGKRKHVWSLTGIHNYLEGHGRLAMAPIVSPLLSQPIVELCLRIPSWLWCANGNNRTVARAAFADTLPAPVIARRTKGAFDGFGAALIDANRPLLRDLLLDGALAREGLIACDQVTLALDHPLSDGEQIVDLLALADVAAWASTWERR
jgi:asparagine synthase (glutamine-hydrolysing)